MSEEIACTDTEDIVCPYCGHKQGDSWEYIREFDPSEEIEVECDKCGKTFLATPDYSVTFSSWKPEAPDEH